MSWARARVRPVFEWTMMPIFMVCLRWLRTGNGERVPGGEGKVKKGGDALGQLCAFYTLIPLALISIRQKS